jgi:hypothetical protein
MPLPCRSFFLGLLLIAGLNSLYVQEAWGQREKERQMEESPPYKHPGAPKPRIFRSILNKISLSLYAGYGKTMYHQNLSGMSIVERNGQQYLYPVENFSGSGVSTAYSHWFNEPVAEPVLNPGPQDKAIRGDSLSLAMRGRGGNLPLGLNLYTVIADRVRLGAGAELEIFSIKELNYSEGAESILSPYQADVQNAFMYRIYGLLGVRAWRWYYYDFVPEVRIGKKSYLTQFNTAQIDQKLYTNLGLSIDKNLSELFRLVLRPSLEWSAFDVRLGEETNGVLPTKTPAFYVQAGVSMNYPRLPRCPISGCQTQLEHVHYGKEYRGQPIYRWQNPKYGQNHPKLEKHKKKRREQMPENRQKRKRKFLFF